MDVSGIIDQVIGRTDNVSLADGDYVDRRQRHLEYLIEEASFLYTAREWRWRRTETTLTIPANQGYVNLPTDFQSIGRKSRICNVSNGRKLDYVEEDELRAEKDVSGTTTSDPLVYSIYGQGTAYEYRLQIITNSIQVQLTFPYNKAMPTLDETTNVNNIKAIPEAYHQTVLVPALRSHAAFSRGESSWEVHEAQRDRGLKFMIRQERLPQDTMGQFPSVFDGERFYGNA